MDSELENELESEFGMFGIDIGGNIAVLEKLIDICKKNDLGSSDVLAKWITYNTKSNHSLTTDVLEEFERKLSSNNKSASISKKKSTPHRSNTYNVNTISQMVAKAKTSVGDDDEEDVIDSYATTPKVKESIKRMHTSPYDDEPPVFNKRIASINGTPRRTTTTTTPSSSSIVADDSSPSTMSSSSMMSPMSTMSPMTPSLKKYNERAGKGDVVCSYGIAMNTSMNWTGCYEGVTVSEFPESNVAHPYKYMFQKLRDKAAVLDEMIGALSMQMKDTLMLDEYENVTTQSQEDITISGRICCDSNGKLNSKSVLLEGSNEVSGGEKIALDLTDVKNYSLFPGQIVAMQGKNITGSKVHPSSIYTGTRLPFYSGTSAGKKTSGSADENHFTMYVTCGPYATYDTEVSNIEQCYTPLDNLMEVLKSEVPDVLVMLGPFVDAKHPLIQTGKIDYTFDDLFQVICARVTSSMKNLKTQVVFIPSQRDACHDYVYPQPPLPCEPTNRIQMLSDPATIMMNDVCVGVTSTDVLFHLGGEEVSAFTVKGDRLGRLADHLLRQQCFYPLHPPHAEVNVDMEQFENYAFMPVTPDVLLLPSDLRYFAKDVDGCLCVNPGRLVKGQTGGTFLKLMVKPQKCENANRSSVVAQSIAQIVRI